MPEVRYNVVSGDWVIFAPGRAKRPQPESPPPAEAEELPEFDPSCPFCPGNETQTTPEIMRIPPADDDAGWRVRVIRNKYPALSMSGAFEEHGPGAGPFKRARPGLGRHEVLIEGRVHNRALSEMDDAGMLEVLTAYRERFAAAADDPGVRHVVIFRNHGAGANASMVHPHAQLVALPVVPPAIGRRIELARAYRRDHSRPMLTDLVQHEIDDATRVVDESDDIVTLVPFAAVYPFEMWIVPRFDPPRFDRATDDQLSALGRAIRRAMGAQRAALEDPDYNLVLQTAPLTERDPSVLPWHVQIIPRLTTPGGLELGGGIQINASLPEDAARALRAARPA